MNQETSQLIFISLFIITIIVLVLAVATYYYEIGGSNACENTDMILIEGFKCEVQQTNEVEAWGLYNMSELIT